MGIARIWGSGASAVQDVIWVDWLDFNVENGVAVF